MSWRDDTPAPIQRDLDHLADEALTTATELLGKQNGKLYPFGVRLLPDGQTSLLLVDASEGKGAMSDPDPVMGFLYEVGTEMRQRAVAFVSVVDTSNGDAVRVELEHCDGGPALAVLLFFRTRRLRRSVEFGELETQLGVHRVWTGEVYRS